MEGIRDSGKECGYAHDAYGNPFGKGVFFTSEATTTDKSFVERRQMVNDFEFGSSI